MTCENCGKVWEMNGMPFVLNVKKKQIHLGSIVLFVPMLGFEVVMEPTK